MSEAQKFPGLWTCPDFSTPLNDSPPYRYACTGMEVTDAGLEAFEQECLKLLIQRN